VTTFTREGHKCKSHYTALKDRSWPLSTHLSDSLQVTDDVTQMIEEGSF